MSISRSVVFISLCYVESAFSPVLILKWQTASVTIQGHGNERDEKCKDKC